MAASSEFIAQITRCQRELHAFITSIVWNLAEADDVLQETNLALWQKAKEYDESREFLPWAMRFAQLQSLAWLKRRRRLPAVLGDGFLEQMASEAVAESPLFEAERRALSTCLEKLPREYRELIGRRYEPDASMPAMAAARRTNPKALSEMLRRIRHSLLACIEKTLAEESLT